MRIPITQLEIKSLPEEQRETYIHRVTIKDEWTCWTFDQKFVSKLRKLGYDVVVNPAQGGLTCKIPVNKLTIRRLH